MAKFLKDSDNQTVSSDPSDCFGNFSRSNPMCFRLCAMRLACCIERDREEEEFMLEEDWQPMGSLIVH